MKAELTGIGSWRLLEVIGAGEHATVYKAQDESAIGSQAKPMALKLLHAPLAADEGECLAFEERLQVQVRLKRLDHPRIVTCYKTERVNGRPFGILELIDATSLERLFPERGKPKFSIEAGTNILLGVLDALSAAANDKAVHGRLGFSDVLIGPEGAVYVTGFGKNGPPQADFLALHRIAQNLGVPWPPEVDAWLDMLAADDCPWRDIRGARHAFPLAYDPNGQKALERAVKNKRKRDEKAAGSPVSTPSPSKEEGAAKPARPPALKPVKTAPVPRDKGQALEAIRQARIVAALAGLILLIGLLREIASR